MTRAGATLTISSSRFAAAVAPRIVALLVLTLASFPTSSSFAVQAFVIIVPTTRTTSTSTATTKSKQETRSGRNVVVLPPPRQYHHDRLLLMKNDDKNDEDIMNPITKASWYAAELFGKVFKDDSKIKESEMAKTTLDLSVPPKSLEETYERIQQDITRDYFLSGVVDRYIYDEDCTFSDPFVSFDGRERFIENLSNLGSFITNYNCKSLTYNVVDDNNDDGNSPPKVETKVK